MNIYIAISENNPPKLIELVECLQARPYTPNVAMSYCEATSQLHSIIIAEPEKDLIHHLHNDELADKYFNTIEAIAACDVFIAYGSVSYTMMIELGLAFGEGCPTIVCLESRLLPSFLLRRATLVCTKIDEVIAAVDVLAYGKS